MGLLLIEIVAASGGTLVDLVDDLLKDVGPAHYVRNDLRLNRPVQKGLMTQQLAENAPASIGGETVVKVATTDGAKYIMSDDSWLLIRPSGTEPVLRVYAEGRSEAMRDALLGYGEQVAAGVV
jgi:phosphomannomutase